MEDDGHSENSVSSSGYATALDPDDEDRTRKMEEENLQLHVKITHLHELLDQKIREFANWKTKAHIDERLYAAQENSKLVNENRRMIEKQKREIRNLESTIDKKDSEMLFRENLHVIEVKQLKHEIADLEAKEHMLLEQINCMKGNVHEEENPKHDSEMCTVRVELENLKSQINRQKGDNMTPEKIKQILDENNAKLLKAIQEIVKK